MILLRSIYLSVLFVYANAAWADQPVALPWQTQLTARPENLPPGLRARPIFGRSAFVMPASAPTIETNPPAVSTNSPFVIAPVASAKPLSSTHQAKPAFAEYRLEIFGVNRPKLVTPPPAATVAVSQSRAEPVPLNFVTKPATVREPAQLKHGQPTFAAVPPANPDFTFSPPAARTNIALLATHPSQPMPGLIDHDTPKPLAVETLATTTPAKKNSAKTKPTKAANSSPKLIVNADNGLGGTVINADDAGRFVILNFPLGQMPRVDSNMTLYRHGVKTATLKITGPQRDDNIAADVLTGIPAEGDAAREE